MNRVALAVLVGVVFITGFVAGRLSAPAAATNEVAPPPAPLAAAMPGPGPSEGGALTGTVAEVIQVPTYTYLRLATAAGEQWAAVPSTTAVTQGQTATVLPSTKMENFTSKSLGRTFASIWFGELAGAGAQASNEGLPPGHPPMPGSGAEALPAGHPPTGSGSLAPGAVAAVARADGALALRVADVFAEKAMLVGRAVKVRGTVTKVTSVQGRHYAHVVDGSGTAAGKDDDLLVILGSEVKANDEVSVAGTVAVNRDVGTGLVYPVVLEPAEVVAANRAK